MAYKSFYRQFRPQNFGEIIGQKHITETLLRQLESGKLSHAYLFCGSRGTGKTSTAKVLARAVNCTAFQNGEICGKCEACKSFAEENLDVLEIDAASNNRVDEIRELREKVKYPPLVGKYKVFIIDEVHMLTDSAFNAFLKTLEEPPAHAIFILATTEVQKLPATILSRCIRFDFKLVGIEALEKLLRRVFKESHVIADDNSIRLICEAGEGSVRDVLSIADMCASFAGGNIKYEDALTVLGAIDKNVLIALCSHTLSGNIEKMFEIIKSVEEAGKSPAVLIREMIKFFRDCLILKTCQKTDGLVALSGTLLEKAKTTAKDADEVQLLAVIERLSLLEQEIKVTLSPQVLFEACLIQCAYLKGKTK